MRLKKIAIVFCGLLTYVLISSFSISNNHLSNITSNQTKVTWSHAITGGQVYEPQDNPPATVAAIYGSKDVPAPGKFSMTVFPMCTGSFLNDEFVLTARHCVDRFSQNTNPLPMESIYVVYRKPQNGKYIVVGVKKMIPYRDDMDIALIQLKHPYPNLPNPVASIYHGYELKSEIIHDKLVIYGYGITYSSSTYTQLNYLNILKMINAYPTGFLEINDVYNELLSVKYSQESSFTTSGDSGGPVKYENHIISVHSGINKSERTGTSVLLSQSVLKWIANSIQAPIFKTPLEYGYLQAFNNSIEFTGWGPILSDAKINILASDSSIVGTCVNFTNTSIDTWKCKANLTSKPDPTQWYYATIINNSTGLSGDGVTFRMDTNRKSLVILEPKPPLLDAEEIYTYDLPIGTATYAIKGKGTPGDQIRYMLIKLRDESTDNFPCTIGSDKVIPDNGLWQCEIRVPSHLGIESYKFEARVPNDKENNNITIASTRYIINVIESPELQIKPAEGDMVDQNHDIQLILRNLSGYESGLLVELIWHINDGEQIIDVPINRESDILDYVYTDPQFIKDNLYDTDVNDANIIALIKDASGEIILEGDVNYSIFSYEIKIINLNAGEQIDPQEIEAIGSVNLSIASKDPSEYYIKVTIEREATGVRSDYCSATYIDQDDKWKCTGDNSIFKHGEYYTIIAQLIKKSDNKSLATNKVGIKIMDAVPVTIEIPHNN